LTSGRLLAGAGYAVAGLLGIAVAVGTAGCGSGGGGALPTTRTSTLPGLTRPATTSPPEGETQTTVTLATTSEAPVVPPVTVTETFPAATETLPARTVTVTKTTTQPATTETLPATTETLPAATITTTAVNPAAAAAAGAAVASSQPEESSTPWGWIAFAILAAAVVIGGLVWWLRSRSARKAQG
jgi:cobalamin biosynthesis Mg chelatase CobN